MDMLSKKSFKKVISVISGVVLAFAMVIGMFAMSAYTQVQAAAKKAATEDVGKVTKKQAKKFAKKVLKANTVKKLLKKYDSVCCYGNRNVFWYDKDKAYYSGLLTGYSVYADDDVICELAGDDELAFRYIVDLESKDDIHHNTYSYLSEEFTVSDILEDEPVYLINNGDTIEYCGKLSKEHTANWKETSWIESEGDVAYSILVVDAKTYEMISWKTYTEGNEDDPEQEMFFYHDDPEILECAIMSMFAKRPEKMMVKATIVLDAGTEKEYRREMTIPANSCLVVRGSGTDETFYSDPECTKPVTEAWDRLSDITLYLKSVE